MRKKCCLGFVLAFVIQGLHAQSIIRGRVLDAANNPMHQAGVSLLNSHDSTVIYHTRADTAGNFLIMALHQGDYLIRTEVAGMAPAHVPFSMTAGVLDTTLQPIKLPQQDRVLDNVSVTATRPALVLKNGAIIMDVLHDPSAAGNTMLELLKRMPGVIVSAQNDISVDNKSGVQFLMDGRPQQLPLAQFVLLLSNMPAEAVSAIELIKNPSAKYNATGSAGLINIISRKARVKGMSGTVTESAGMGKRFGNGINVALDFRSDKLSIFTNVTYLNRNPLAYATIDRSLKGNTGTKYMHSETTTSSTLNSLLLKGGVEYAISKRTVLGLSASDAPVSSQDVFTNETTLAGGNLYYQLLARTNSDDNYVSTTATAYLQHQPDTNGTQFNCSVDWTDFSFKENRLNENRFLDKSAGEAQPTQTYKNDNSFDFLIVSPKLDYTVRLPRNLRLEAGAKAGFIRNHSNTLFARSSNGGTFAKDTNFSNAFRYREQITAGYCSLMKSWKSVNAQLGLRGEHTSINTTDISSELRHQRQYFNLFPNASLNYKAGEKSSYQLTYSYRIDRPAYDQLIPYKVFNDELNYSTGNPDLRPQYSHVATFDYSYNRFLFVSLGYTNIQDCIYSYPVTAANSRIQVDTMANIANRSLLSGSLTLQRQLAKWYQLQLTGTIAQSSFRGELNGTDAGSHAVIGFIRIANDMVLPYHIRLQLNAGYYTPYQDAIQRYAARGTVDISLQRRFLKDRLNAVLAVNDLLYTDKTTVTTSLPDQTNAYSVKNDTRRIRLTLTYRFGNMRVERKVKNTPEEAAQRIKKAS